MQHFADRLITYARERGGPVCVGLDPVYEKLPAALQLEEPVTGEEKLEAIRRFGEGVLEAVADVVPCVKMQLACFERYGTAGWAVYEHLLQRARDLDLLIIADGKRGDIAGSSAHYAAGLLEREGADALTVTPYVGRDGLGPFVETAVAEGKGLFALVRTSNPGAEPIQAAALADGRTVSELIADEVAALGTSIDGAVGENGYSALGAVVGATKPGAIGQLRQHLARQIMLVPGFGAQGGTARDVAEAFDERGEGALVTASRSIIYAFEAGDTDWQSPITEAAGRFRDEVAAVAHPA